MKKLLLFVLAASLAAAAQGKGGSRPAGPPAGAGPGSGMSGSQRPEMTPPSRPETTGKRDDHMNKRDDHMKSHEQKPLSDKHTNSGSFQMLQDKTGKSADELKAMYAVSGAKNYGQFVSAVIVSKNLGLDTQQVLDGLKTKSLGQTLQDLGVSGEQANSEIKKAEAQAKAAKRKNQ